MEDLLIKFQQYPTIQTCVRIVRRAKVHHAFIRGPWLAGECVFGLSSADSTRRGVKCLKDASCLVLALYRLLGERLAKRQKAAPDDAQVSAGAVAVIKWNYNRHDGGEMDSEIPQEQRPHGLEKYDFEAEAVARILKRRADHLPRPAEYAALAPQNPHVCHFLFPWKASTHLVIT